MLIANRHHPSPSLACIFYLLLCFNPVSLILFLQTKYYFSFKRQSQIIIILKFYSLKMQSQTLDDDHFLTILRLNLIQKVRYFQKWHTFRLTKKKEKQHKLAKSGITRHESPPTIRKFIRITRKYSEQIYVTKLDNWDEKENSWKHIN